VTAPYYLFPLISNTILPPDPKYPFSSPTLLPNLRQIAFKSSDPKSFFGVISTRRCASPLTHLDISLTTTSQMIHVTLFVITCTSLRHLTIRGGWSCFHNSHSRPQPFPAICPSLRGLKISAPGVMLFSLLMPLPGFPNLLTFSYNLVPDPTHPDQFPFSDLERAFHWLYYTRGSLYKQLKISSKYRLYEEPYTLHTEAGGLSELLSLQHLTRLHIGLHPHVDFDGPLLVKIGKSLSRLEVADFIGLPIRLTTAPYKPLITLADVAAFLAVCKRLHSLSICFDANLLRRDEDLKDLSVYRVASPVQSLHVGGSLIHHREVHAVADRLGAMLPDLQVAYVCPAWYFPQLGERQRDTWVKVFEEMPSGPVIGTEKWN
jgi:hypothetical protein